MMVRPTLLIKRAHGATQYMYTISRYFLKRNNWTKIFIWQNNPRSQQMYVNCVLLRTAFSYLRDRRLHEQSAKRRRVERR